jgi:hypothetical protein
MGYNDPFLNSPYPGSPPDAWKDYYDTQRYGGPAIKFFKDNAPSYNPAYDKGTMSIYGETNDPNSPLHMDTRGLEKYRNEALRTGPSAWARLSNQQQSALAKEARGLAAVSNARGQAEGGSALAMGGGLDSGGRRRLALEGARNQGISEQEAAGRQASNALEIGKADEQNRIQMLGAEPGMELGRANYVSGARKYDIQNQIIEGQAKNAFDSKKFGDLAKLYGAEKQAQATENAGK